MKYAFPSHSQKIICAGDSSENTILDYRTVTKNEIHACPADLCAYKEHNYLLNAFPVNLIDILVS